VCSDFINIIHVVFWHYYSIYMSFYHSVMLEIYCIGCISYFQYFFFSICGSHQMIHIKWNILGIRRSMVQINITYLSCLSITDLTMHKIHMLGIPLPFVKVRDQILVNMPELLHCMHFLTCFIICQIFRCEGLEQRFLTFWLLRTPTESLLEAADP
jgi:hypothetical protein